VPFSEATVELLKADGEQVVASTHPDSQGKFEFAGIAVGEYVLRAKYKGYYDTVSTKFQITSEDVAEVVMPMGGPDDKFEVCM
jgi:hypothetical protein